MSGSKARQQAIDGVNSYEPPKSIFPSPEQARRDLRPERLHQGGDDEAAAEAGVQVGHGDDRALQAARSCGRRRRGGPS